MAGWVRAFTESGERLDFRNLIYKIGIISSVNSEDNMAEILMTFMEVAAAFGIVFLFSTLIKQDNDQDHDDHGKLQRVRVPVSNNRRRYGR
jgi:hypothetical protein